jgi:superfamily I DNA/RNA helicase
VHKAKGLEWPRVLMSSDFNQFVELEKGKPVIDTEEAYIMYVALTRAREKAYLGFLKCEHVTRASPMPLVKTRRGNTRRNERRLQIRAAAKPTSEP